MAVLHAGMIPQLSHGGFTNMRNWVWRPTSSCRHAVSSSELATLQVRRSPGSAGEKSTTAWLSNSGFPPCQMRKRRSHSTCPGLVMAMSGGSSTSITVLLDRGLDCFSCFLFQRLKGAFSPHFPTNFDPLNWLPVEIHSYLHGSEEIAISMLREFMVFGAFYFLYNRGNNICRWLYRIYTANSRGAQEKEDADYDRSVWQAAEYPIQVLIVVWAITHFVRSLATFFHMEQLMEHDVIIKLRAIGLFAVVTWFFFRWKQLFVDDLILQHKMDRARIMGVDKVVSLVLYFLAASCIAEVMGIALHSLLAVGGISGLAVGLAAREVASNFFGGLVLLITRPFVIGDSIKAGSFSGSVQDIGFMQTKVLSDGIPILVPNQAFTNQIITNYSRAKTKVLEATFQLPAGDVVAVNSITERVSKYLQSHPQVENERATPLCYLNNLSHLGPQVQLYCAIKSSGGVVYFRMKQQILLQVGQIIDDALGKDDSWPSLSPLLWELRMLLLYSPAISGSGDHTIL